MSYSNSNNSSNNSSNSSDDIGITLMQVSSVLSMVSCSMVMVIIYKMDMLSKLFLRLVFLIALADFLACIGTAAGGKHR